jgi:hypothetical protein
VVEILRELGGKTWRERNRTGESRNGDKLKHAIANRIGEESCREEERAEVLPLALRMRSTLLPVTNLTLPTPWESRRMTPICEGVRPFLASLQIRSVTSGVVVFSHEGAVRLKGWAEPEIPLPGPCIRPMFDDVL